MLGREVEISSSNNLIKCGIGLWFRSTSDRSSALDPHGGSNSGSKYFRFSDQTGTDPYPVGSIDSTGSDLVRFADSSDSDPVQLRILTPDDSDDLVLRKILIALPCKLHSNVIPRNRRKCTT